MVISPNDFSLWSRLTGNKYPSTPKERAQKGPEVQRFIQNLGKEGMLGGKENKEEKKDSNLGKKIATGALIAGGLAAAVAAGRDERVQNTIKKAVANTKTQADDFLSNFARAKVVDADIVDASGDVTPDPAQQQSNTAPTQRAQVTVDVTPEPQQQSVGESPYNQEEVDQILKDSRKIVNKETSIDVTPEKDSFTPLAEGKTYFTEGAVDKEDPYGSFSNLEQRVDRTYGKYLGNLKPEDAATTRASLIREAGRERDYGLGYINSLARGRTDEDATITARKFGGYDLDPAVGPPTPFRKALGELKIASQIPAQVDELISLVKTGPKITLPESVQEPGALVQLGTGNTTNVMPTNAGEVGGDSLTNEHLTKMEIDNVIDDARNIVRKPTETGVSQNRVTTTLLPRSGPVGDESTQDFIDRKFSVPAGEAGDPLPEKSGTVIDPARFPGGNIKDRLNDLRTQNMEALASGNVTPAMQKVLGERLKSGQIYKSSPELLQRDSEILTSAMISGDSGEYFGPEATKVKQNIKLGAQFPEVLDDPTRETVIFQGEERPRTDFEQPVTTPDSQQRYEANVQKEIDYRDAGLQEAEDQFATTSAKVENLQNRIAESGKNIKNVIAGLPERTDLSNTEKAITKTGLETTLGRMRKQYSGLDSTLDRARNLFNKRATGLDRNMQENIADIPVEKTIKSQTGELYEIRDKVNPDTGEKTETIQPMFTRDMDTKQEFDTGVGLEKQEIETGSSRGSQLQEIGVGRRKLLSINDLKGRGEDARNLRNFLIDTAQKQGVDLFDYSPEGMKATDEFMRNKQIVSNPENPITGVQSKVVGEKPVGSQPRRSIEAQIQDVYSPKYNYDAPTIRQKVAELQERFKRQQATRRAGGLTVEDIQDL